MQRLEPSTEEDFVHIHLALITRGIIKVYNEMENDNAQSPRAIIPYEVLVIIIVGLFFLLLIFIHCYLQCYKHRRRLWNSIRANLSQPVLPTAPPMPQENDTTPIGDIDVPPDYTVVVEQKNVAANTSDNCYPKVAGGKKLETPPPAYMTLQPFK
ncbi:hypothetical protein HNY73_003845 [Argiope bruennichi]|uniref:Uncharacterized protein n=1 Tax=Argiope bruennichi TaxID=94029 RepID=A0A8T0FRC2_ARGBR|nr:hypothetical protein HNY73_003845 [Argiope bruennichi]